jgi:hypothetical protein
VDGRSVQARSIDFANFDELLPIGGRTELLVLPENPEVVREPRYLFKGFFPVAVIFLFPMIYLLYRTWRDDGSTPLALIVAGFAALVLVAGFIRALKS